MPAPAYFLTWHTYGTWLHGDDGGSVDRHHNTKGAPRLAPDRALFERSRASLVHPPVVLSPAARQAVDRVMREHCVRRGWTLKALAVRSNHVHAVLLSRVGRREPPVVVAPETIVKQLKEWGTRTLRRQRFIGPRVRPWTDHGSTIYLYEPGSLEAAIEYVNTQDEHAPPPGREDWDVKLGLRPRATAATDNPSQSPQDAKDTPELALGAPF